MPDQSGLPAPYLDPSQYPNYLDAQRKQMIAQMLMGSLQQSNQTPDNWDAMKVVPKRNPLQTVATLATALAAGKAQKSALDSQQQYMQGLYNPPSPAPAPSGPGAGIISPDAPPAAQAAAQAVTAGQPPSGIVAPAPAAAPAQNPLIPPGMSRATATGLMNMMGPGEYAKTLLAPQFSQTEMERNLRAAGVDPNSPQGQAFQQQVLAKQGRDYEAVRGNNTIFDKASGRPIFTAPDQGINTTWDAQGNPHQATVEGAPAATAEAAAARTAGTQSQTPIKLGTDENGKDIYGYPAPPALAKPPAGALNPVAPPVTSNATAPGKTASPAVIESQKSGAQAGQTYSSELAKNAEGALEVRRSLSELRNLASQATPNAMNEGKLKVGSWMIAAGADPNTVSAKLGVSVPALQAAEHTQGGLAVSAIHGMTSRGTNFDLETFMRQNPNLDMNSPEAFNRVADYMDAKAQQTIGKQQDFAQGLKTKAWGSPDQWEANHSAHWNDLQNQAINAGQFNTKKPGAPVVHSSADLQAEMQRRGLKPPQ